MTRTPDTTAWTAAERELLHRHQAGATIVTNLRRRGHPHLIAWAKTEGVFTLIDRKSRWGNPFVMPDDGDRVEVIDKYRDHLTRHPELTADIGELTGRVLGCWCAPQACHGHVLAAHADLEPDR